MSEASIELARLKAAEKALEIIAGLRPRVIGIGTGSTIDKFIDLLPKAADRLKDSIYVCASLYTTYRVKALGYTVAPSSAIDSIDIYIDGADEVDQHLNMVKGGGGALTLEKVLAYASHKRIYIVDYMKLVPSLCYRHPIPIEVLKEALSIVYTKLKQLGLNPVIRKSSTGKYGFVVADTGGAIIDIKPATNLDFRELERALKMIPGIVETGLFIDLADIVIVGYPDRVEILSKELRQPNAIVGQRQPL